MELPIKFPSDVEVIAEDVARFRALAPEDRVRTIGEMVRLYHFLAANSARSEALVQIERAEKTRGRQAIEEFVTRHG